MTSPQSVSSAVTVSVSPQVAFTAFTEEMDLWWVRGPINFYDSARAVKMVCEPGVGGRVKTSFKRRLYPVARLGQGGAKPRP